MEYKTATDTETRPNIPRGQRPPPRASFPSRLEQVGVCLVSSDIPAEWAQRWASDFEVHPELRLPAENKFIGLSFKMQKQSTFCDGYI